MQNDYGAWRYYNRVILFPQGNYWFLTTIVFISITARLYEIAVFCNALSLPRCFYCLDRQTLMESSKVAVSSLSNLWTDHYDPVSIIFQTFMVQWSLCSFVQAFAPPAPFALQLIICWPRQSLAMRTLVGLYP